MNSLTSRGIKVGLITTIIIVGVLTCRYFASNALGPESRKKVRKDDYLLLQRVFKTNLPNSLKFEKVLCNQGGMQVPSMAYYTVQVDARDFQELLQRSQAMRLHEKIGQSMPYRSRISAMLQLNTDDFERYLNMPAYKIDTPIAPPPDPAFGKIIETYIIVDERTSPTLKLHIDSNPFILRFPLSPEAGSAKQR